MLKHGRWVLEAGCRVLQGVMLEARCCFRGWLRSGVREAAQHRAASDTYRLRRAACGDGAPQREGLGCRHVPGGVQGVLRGVPAQAVPDGSRTGAVGFQGHPPHPVPSPAVHPGLP